MAAALLAGWDLGADVLSAPSDDLLADAAQVGRGVIPTVREEVAEREAEGRPCGIEAIAA